MTNAQTLLEKIQALAPERIAEVEDFVEFITSREQERLITRGAAVVGVPSFATVWDNSEDEVYDTL